MARGRADDEPEDDDGDWEDLFDGVEEAGDARALARGLAFGFLAMAPLFALYEMAAAGATRRAAAELVLTYPLRPLGERLDAVRQVGLAALAAASLVWCARRHLALGPKLARVPVEGLLAALLLGPLTALLMQALGTAPLATPGEVRGSVPSFTTAAFVAGAAAWEELLFRVGLFSLFWMLTRRLLGWAGLGEGPARVAAELVAPLASALAFAAFHLDAVLRVFGPGGEAFDAGVFAWRALAGLFLAVVFRLRGPGVAAWAHALFNVSLVLGAGPRVFL